MRRKAILVGSDNTSPSNPLGGATKDIKDLRAYLQTPTGGAWFAEEIDWYATLSLAHMRYALEDAKANHDYLFVATMLHGARGPSGSFVYLNEKEPIRIDEIARSGPQAKRVLILSGGCRDEIPALPPPQKRVAGTGDDVAGLPSAAYMKHCRAVLDELVMRARPGGAVMYACSPTESSWYIDGYGGVFTQALLQRALEWSSNFSDGRSVRKCITAEKALNAVRAETTEMVRHLGYTQTPEIRPENPPEFPFILA